MVERRIGDAVIRLVRGDITDMDVEAIVFDITHDLKLGSGYGGAIAQRGGPSIQKELDGCPPLAVGDALVTKAGTMKTTFIVHVNGPKFHEENTEDKLRRTVDAALRRAEEKGITQLAFPPIGTGLYQVPLDLCARVLTDTVTGHLSNSSRLREVVLVALDSREEEPLAAALAKGA